MFKDYEYSQTINESVIGKVQLFKNNKNQEILVKESLFMQKLDFQKWLDFVKKSMLMDNQYMLKIMDFEIIQRRTLCAQHYLFKTFYERTGFAL